MWLRVVPASLVVATAIPAQPSRVVDEGSFTITRAGAPFGTEAFQIIRRIGADGIEYVAQATRIVEGRILRSSLTADSAGTPTSYSRHTTGSVSNQLQATRAMSRLTVNEEGAQASSRDYVFGPGTVILDDDVIYQLYFVTWREPRDLGFVAPAGRVTGRGVLTEVGPETIRVGNSSISAIRYSFGSGDDRREVWVDSEKRLLKVTHPAMQIVGTRDQPPR